MAIINSLTAPKQANFLPPPPPFDKMPSQLHLDDGVNSSNLCNHTHSHTPNAVHPAWRHTATLVEIGTVWDWQTPAAVNATSQARLAGVIDPALRALLEPQLLCAVPPYANIGNYARPGFVRNMYGPNVSRLRRVKHAWDPHDLFNAPYNVGGDALAPDDDSRFCQLQGGQ
jgi:hypothetical protein